MPRASASPPGRDRRDPARAGATPPVGAAGEVLRAFLHLGTTSFGGPIAHLGYFRREFVTRRQWLDDARFAQLLALCQFLPGPASSQLGLAIGLLRAGWPGALAAFVGFTLPSAALLVAFAAVAPHLGGAAGGAALQGLKLVALAVVAHGVMGMARRLCPDVPRAALALAGAAALVLGDGAWLQLLVIAAGAVLGSAVSRAAVPGGTSLAPPHGPRVGLALLAAFGVLLLGLPLAANLLAPTGGAGVAGPLPVAAAFYRAGALVFGGGHVVLPWLEQAVVATGWIGPDDFLAGYGAAQAVPGPMFSFAAYLGAHLPGAWGGLAGASLALLAIFLPGFLLLGGVLPFWSAVAAHPRAAGAVAGVNAAVVGLLAAAFIDPIAVTAIAGVADVAIALMGLAALSWRRTPPLAVVLWCVAARLAAGLLGWA